MPTEVTCRDTESGKSETKVIEDDWMVVTDGVFDSIHVQRFSNGTAIITIKRKNTPEDIPWSSVRADY